ncbi:MAG: aminoglycoside phosphotransferase family protein [Microgenomates group bacterium]
MSLDPVIAAELIKLESKYTYRSEEVYYFNVHRPASLVRQLQHRTEEFDDTVVPAIFEHALHEKVYHHEVFTNMGTGHIIVFVQTGSGRDLVLRANHALTTPEYYMDWEREIASQFEAIGVHSVPILYSDTSRQFFPFDYQIIEKLSGKDLELEWEGTQDNYNQLSFDLGQIFAKQYQLPATGWGRWTKDATGQIVGALPSHHDYLTAYLDHDLEFITFFKFISSADSNRLHAYFNSPDITSLFADTTQGYYMHHDLPDHNVRYDNHKIISIFDWENAVVFDPICDLGAVPTWKSHYPREKQFIDGFISELGHKPANLEAKIAVYLLRTMLWKIQFALKGNRLSARHINLFEEALIRNGLSEVTILGQPSN